MKESSGIPPAGASRTAFATAFLRAFHSANESRRIFDDWMAAKLLTAEEYASFEELYYRRSVKDAATPPAESPQRTSVVAAAMRGGAAAGILCRARFAEDALEEAVQEGIRQYVILGAGFDTFALRRPDLLSRIRVIEVDHPATQAIKRKRLADLGCALPSSLHFVPVDFSREELPQALCRSCYDPEIPSFFSWLGVTYYLERNHLYRVLRGLRESAAPSSRIAFDYMNAEAFEDEKASPQMRRLREKVRLLGEPMKTGLDPGTLAKDLGEVGWELRQHLSAAQIEETFLGGDRAAGFRAGRHLHLALAVVADGKGRRP